MKKRVGIIFGGKSGEHEVSIYSAINIYDALNRELWIPFLIGVDKEGNFRYVDDKSNIENIEDPKRIKIKEDTPIIHPIKGDEDGKLYFFYSESGSFAIETDFIFPIIHGNLGEDGSLQGFLKWFNVPFAGPSVLGSAIGMDKDVTKRLLNEAGIRVCKFLTIRTDELCDEKLYFIEKELGFPLFVKPSSTGSSIGISKVKRKEDLKGAIEEAFKYDKKVIVEEFIPGREIECAVLGNEEIFTSCLGEIVPKHEFYSYEAKYIDPDGALLLAPAEVEKEIEMEIREIAKRAFKILECEGMARVDFFLKGKEIYLNEINTLPGFTKISMYPKLWELSGLSYSQLLDKLILLGFERFEREKKIKNIY